MGVVYQAEDTRLQRPVALKFLPPESFAAEDRERFFNEARSAALIRHPNVAPIYDVEEADGRVFISMAYMEGATLAHLIEAGPLAISKSIDIAIQVARGLEEAHRLGIVHRDIKSGNIMVAPDGHASILDFGLALLPGAARITATGLTSGTPAYMSPEQARGEAVDARSDIWSLGVVLFESLTGKLPFRGANALATVQAIVSTAAPRVSSVLPGVPAALDAVVAKALEKSPGRRWHSAGELAAALKSVGELLAAGSVSATMTLPGLAARRPLSVRDRRIWAIAAAVTALAGGGSWYVATHRPQPPVVRIAAVAGPKQVAVLPFQVEGANAEAIAVADGLVAVITDTLADPARGQGKVTPVPAAEIRRRQIATPSDARRWYGADLAVAGSARLQGGRIHFTLRLVETGTSREAASAAFDYDRAAPHEAETRAVDEVARMLDLKPAPQATGNNSPDAYSAYLEGRGLLSRYDVKGNLERAASALRRAVRADPRFTLAWVALAEVYWREWRNGGRQSADQALECARRAVELDPDHAGARTILGMVYGTGGRNEDAIAELRTALRLAPGNAEAPRELARIYTALGRFSDAEASYRQAIDARPTDWYAHLVLGQFFTDRERYGEAETAFHRAAELAPGNHIAAANLASAYMVQGKYAGAVEVLTRSLKIRQESRTYALLGTVLFYQHKFPEAASAMETALDLDPGPAEYWGNLGTFYKWIPGGEARMKTALARAIELAEKKTALTPTDYGARANIAEYRARLGDAKGSIAEISRIPEAARQPLASRLAVAYELTGNRAKAIDLIGSAFTNAASLTQVKDDPDLAGLWADRAFQAAVRRTFQR